VRTATSPAPARSAPIWTACVVADLPASRVGEEYHFTASYGGCSADTCIKTTLLNLRRILTFQVDGAPTNRLYPPDNTLRKVTIRPSDIDPRFAGLTVKLVAVRSDSNGSGTQPEFEILDAISDSVSPEITLKLRAALNPGGQRRVYTLEFDGSTPGADGVQGKATLLLDVSEFAARAGGFGNNRN
jgi:hypothetical protein